MSLIQILVKFFSNKQKNLSTDYYEPYISNQKYSNWNDRLNSSAIMEMDFKMRSSFC